MKTTKNLIPNEEQNKALLSEAENVLVLGESGFGKTSLLAMKAEALIKEKKCIPSEILILSDTEYAANELKAFISRTDVKICTLHKYATDIICKCEGKVPKINKKSLSDFAFEEIKKLDKKPGYHSLILKYSSYNKNKNDSDYEKYLMQNPPTTYAGEKVKSRGEVEIADYLYMAKIEYEYEAEYEKDTRTEKYGQYYPDFYLPDYGIYIEYFGVDREGKVPSYFRGDNPSAEYNAQMQWKKDLHVSNGTKFIDLYAYQLFEGMLISELQKGLLSLGVKIKSKKKNDFQKNMLLLNASENIISYFNVKNKNIPSEIRENFGYIIEKYNEYVERSGEIKLKDVIPYAEKYVLQGKYQAEYKYILADEFDRFSEDQLSFINSLKKSKNMNLFLAGDNTLRFAEKSEFADFFKKNYPFADIIELKKSYRLPSEVLLILKAELIGGECPEYEAEKAIDSLDFVESYTYEGIIKKLSDKLDMLPAESTVLVCMRKATLFGDKYELKYDIKNKTLNLKYILRPDLKIIFAEVRNIGGSCADYVFAECTERDKEYLYSAATKAKKKVCFMGISGNMPEYADKIKKHLGRTDVKKAGICPRCGGTLIKVKGKYGDFIGCSNYALKKCKYRIPLKR